MSAGKSARGLRMVYAVINHPVECKFPYVARVLNPNPLVEELYKQQHKDQAFLSKRDVERLWIMPMTGPRYSILRMEVPEEDKFCC